MTTSFYEALLHGMAGDVTGRRALFVFVVEHSEAMQRPFGTTGRTRLEAVVEHLNEMAAEMAKIDRSAGGHIDLALIGHGVRGADGSEVDTLWTVATNGREPFVRALAEVPIAGPGACVASRFPATDSRGSLDAALRTAGSVVTSWAERNRNPLCRPVVINVCAGDQAGAPGIEGQINRLKGAGSPYIFNCCLVDSCADSVVFPRESAIPDGLCRQLRDVSSDMPPLMVDIARLLKGEVTERCREAAAAAARSCGLPGHLGRSAANLAGEFARRQGLSVPTGRPGWSARVNVAVEGLTVDSCTGFALVRERAGFRIFTRLCN